MINILQHHNILYVEDEPVIQKSIVQLLSTYFKTVFIASDGEEALALFEEHTPDVLLLDINLPKISGLKLAEIVRKTHLDMPIVMLTAHTDESMLLSAINLNICKYLVKPLQGKEFKDALLKIATKLEKKSNNVSKIHKDIVWDREEEILLYKNEKVSLTSKEQVLMRLLISKPKECISHEEIMAMVWEDKFEVEITFDSVKNLVKTLRKKLPENLIVSIYGKGYALA